MSALLRRNSPSPRKVSTTAPSAKPGKPAVQCAITAIHAASGFTRVTSRADNHGAAGEISAAINPTIVIGATAGAANKLATMLIGEINPEIATIIGAQKSIAAIGGAMASAKSLGVKRAKNFTTRGAKSNNPAVARTESAKPGSRLCQGSAITTAPIAKPRAGSESAPLCVPFAINKTAAIAAARNTDGEGRTRVIKQIREIAVAPRR